MKVKSVRITFKEMVDTGKSGLYCLPDYEHKVVQVIEGQASVDALHYLVRDGMVCINYKDTHTGDRIGDSYPIQDIVRVQTSL